MSIKNKKSILLICLVFLFTIRLFADVDQSGNFNYEIPINIPSGTNKILPELSLLYNSANKNKYIGIGWDLGGISAITRDDSYGINFDNSDHYLFDGQKLIFNNNDGYYHTERESYLRIQAYNLNSTSSYWIVTDKNGIKKYYGNTVDSHIDAVNKNGKALLWALCKVEDVHGNYYTIEYNEDITNGDFYPTKIIYTKNDSYSLNKYNTILFSYENRTDHYKKYMPTLIDMDKRLKWITIKIGTDINGDGGYLLRKYRLDYVYGTTTRRNRLIGFQEYGNDGNYPSSPWVDDNYIPTGSSLPLNSFEYQDAGELDFTCKSNPIDTSEIGTSVPRFGDWNGDGKQDVMFFYPKVGQNKWFINDGELNFTYKLNPIPMSAIDNKPFAYFSDWNGDGKTDVMFRWHEDGQNRWFINEEEDGELSFKYISNPIQPGLIDGGYMDVYYGDWNGDGITDLMVFARKDGTNRWFINDGELNFTYISNPITSSLIDYTDPHFGDWNGDGKQDVMFYNNDGTNRWFINNGENGNLSFEYVSNPIAASAINDIDLYFGDWNADGVTDLMAFSNNNGSNRWFINNGELNFTTINDPIENSFISSSVPHFGDWNGDGIQDIMFYWTEVGQNEWFINDGNLNFLRVIDPIERTLIDSGSLDMYDGDWTGDGITNLLLYAQKDGENRWLVNTCLNPDIITKINNGKGGTIAISYKPAPQLEEAVIPSKTDYPLIANKNPKCIVTNISTDNGLGEITSNSYEYYNGLYYNGYWKDMANLGFEWIKKTDDNTGNYIKTYYNQNKPYHGYTIKSKTYDTNDNLYIRTENQYDYRIDDNDYPEIKFIYQTNSYTYNYNGDELSNPVIFRQEYINYDEYGNCIEIMNHGNLDTINDDVKNIIYFTGNLTNYVIVPYKTEEYFYDLNNSWGLAKETRLYYDNLPIGQIDKGLITRNEFENGVNDSIVTFGYDNWGNQIWLKDARVNAGEYTGNTKEIIYDTDYHTYPVQIINALNQSSEIIYDLLMRPIEIIDINGVIINNVYDVFNRVIKVINDGDSETYPTKEIIYNNLDNVAPICIITKIRENAGTNNTFDIYTYYDGLNRVIQTKKESENPGEWLVEDFYYDSSGRKYKLSVPYIWNGTPDNQDTIRDNTKKFTLTEFDTAGRINKITKPDTTYTRRIYNQNSTLVIDENNHVIETEVIGNIKKVMIYTGEYPNHILYSTTTTKKGRDGSETIDEKGNITRTFIDMLNRTIQLNDPNKGTIIFNYDENGNIINKTDAKNNTINYVYDKLNRKTLIDYPTGDDVQFFYDEDNNYGFSKGKLTREVYGIGNKKYVYNSRGQVIECTHTIDGIAKTTSYTYDSMNRIVTITYPDGEVVTKTYNAGGGIETIAGIDNYVTDIDYNENGMIDYLSYGNGLNTTYDFYDESGEFDPSAETYYSYRLKSITTNNPNISSIEYEYDKVGNVIKKIDLINSDYSETFDYDALNRLSSANAVIYGANTYSYDKINNITHKNGKVFSYQGNTYFLINDSIYNYTYDANGNMLTKVSSSENFLYSYDYDNRLTSVDEKQFFYGTKFERVKKVENSITTRYFFPFYIEEDYSSDGTIDNTIKYYDEYARRDIEDGLVWFTRDHLKSSTRITDATGQLVKNLGYKPYGNSSYSSGSINIKKQFCNKEKDATGLYYYGARYYDSDIGRFITPDPASDGLNHYAYCRNNPLTYIDPTGLWSYNAAKGIIQSKIKNYFNYCNNFFTRLFSFTNPISSKNNNPNTDIDKKSGPNGADDARINSQKYYDKYSYYNIQNISQVGIDVSESPHKGDFIKNWSYDKTPPDWAKKAMEENSNLIWSKGYAEMIYSLRDKRDYIDPMRPNVALIPMGKLPAIVQSLSGLIGLLTDKRPYKDRMSPQEAQRYQRYWTKKAPENSNPNSMYKRYTETGEIKQGTAYDSFGRKSTQYDLISRHSFHKHTWEYNADFPFGLRSGKIDIY